MKNFIAFLSVLSMVLFFQFGYSQTIYVNSSTGNDATGNGSSGSPYKTFNKGYTIAAAGNTINLAGTFTWTDADETGDAATSGYTINKNLTITGQGAGQTIIQAAATENTADRRVISIGYGYSVTIQNLTIRYGRLTSTNYGGAGIYVSGNSNLNLTSCIVELNDRTCSETDGRYAGGGGIMVSGLSTGNVTIDKCQIQYNSNLGGSGNSGGGIHTEVGNTSSGILTITNSTINNNSSVYGAAIYARSPRIKVANSTICYNSGSYIIYPHAGSSSYNQYAFFTNVTIAYNSLGTSGYCFITSGLADGSYTPKGCMMKNTIIAQNKRTDNSQYDYNYSGASSLTNNGYNLVETQSGGGTHFTNGVNGCITGIQANLRLNSTPSYNNTLNGTQTLALLGGSVAVNAGSSSANGTENIPVNDQRGKTRTGNYDIGAFEYNAHIWKGTVSTDFAASLNWYDTIVPPAGEDVDFDANAVNDCILDADRILGCLYNGHSTYKFILNNKTLTLLGDIALCGCAQLDASAGNIVFSGGTYSNTITPSSSSLSVNNLNINNGYGIILAGNLTVTNNLTLTNGILSLGAFNLTLGSSATISGTPSSSNMIVPTGTGELRKVFTGTGSFTYPVGDNTGTKEYSPIILNFTSGTFSSAYAGITLGNSKYSNNASSNDYLNRYWTVNQSGISGFTCDVTAQYLVADIVGTESNIYTGKYSAGWTLLNQANVVNHTLSGTVTGFSTFTGGQQSSMPVELSSFSSCVSERDVKLLWITSCETNNSGFEIQKSNVNNQNAEWTVAGYIRGSGTKITPTNYSFTDVKLKIGKYLYRLKQIDNNGNFKYHNLAGFVEIGTPAKFKLSQNYPNPFNPFTKIDFQIPNDAKVTLKIYDILGREIVTLINDELKKADYYTVDFNASKFASGIYLYRITADKFVSVKKLTLLK
jgi:hypothetical protein